MKRASLIAQLERIHLQCRRPLFDSWVRKIRWRRDRLPTPILLGCPCGSASKESACNVGDLGWQCGRPEFAPWDGKIPWRRERLPTSVFCPEEFHRLCSSWGRKESDRTEWLSLHFTLYEKPLFLLEELHSYLNNLRKNGFIH